MMDRISFNYREFFNAALFAFLVALATAWVFDWTKPALFIKGLATVCILMSWDALLTRVAEFKRGRRINYPHLAKKSLLWAILALVALIISVVLFFQRDLYLALTAVVLMLAVQLERAITLR